MNNKKEHKLHTNPGFTLAEVLTTLTIIGIIAMLTLPELINSVQDQQYASALKKNYSLLSQATINLTNNYGTINTSSYINFKNDYKKVLTIIKDADNLDTSIYPRYLNYYKGAYGADNGTAPPLLVLSDGTILIFWADSSTCNATYGGITTVCGAIGIDVNGKKGPNMIGKDYFETVLYKTNGTYNIIPEGSQTGASCTANSASWATSLGCTQNIILGTPLP